MLKQILEVPSLFQEIYRVTARYQLEALSPF